MNTSQNTLPPEQSDEDVAREIDDECRTYNSETNKEEFDIQHCSRLVARHVAARTAELERQLKSVQDGWTERFGPQTMDELVAYENELEARTRKLESALQRIIEYSKNCEFAETNDAFQQGYFITDDMLDEARAALGGEK